jgi:hypothetical protein
MSDDRPSDASVKLAYEQLCATYHAIEDFRGKLLGFLPLASGTGIVLLLDEEKARATDALSAIGTFGFLITLGLFAYELYGMKKCGALIEAGKRLEESLRIDGHFRGRPRELAGFINEPFASGIIYPAVMAAWIYLACSSGSVRPAWLPPLIVFAVGFLGSIAYNRHLRNHPEVKLLQTHGRV